MGSDRTTCIRRFFLKTISVMRIDLALRLLKIIKPYLVVSGQERMANAQLLRYHVLVEAFGAELFFLLF
jgi:hypothetical protein